jgi:RNA polymerase sigma factor (sigma-70 family)
VLGRPSTRRDQDVAQDQDETPPPGRARKRARIPDGEREEKVAQLVLRRTKLSASEAALLREVFPEILGTHHDEVWNQLRKRRLNPDEAEDLLQEVFTTLYHHIMEHGFPDSFPKMLHTITEGKLLNHVRAGKRTPISVGLPSSGSEKPRSSPDVERALDLRELARRLLPQLHPDHQLVVDQIVLQGVSSEELALALGLPVGTVKSRLFAAKRALAALAEQFLPPSQRGPT